MSRYIDADAFEVFGYDSQEGTFDDGVRFVLEKIDAMPTIDAVEVVRCKDCVHWKDEGFDDAGKCELWNIVFEYDWFCADGEKGEQE